MLAQSVVEKLKVRGKTLATCESLTAGLLSATVADVPGASAVLRGGLVTYATDTKSSVAEVDRQILDAKGPVSANTAAAMAEGAARILGADIAISLTGVAGPDEQDGHPVGEVFAGMCIDDEVIVVRWMLEGNRAQIRSAAVTCALQELESRI